MGVYDGVIISTPYVDTTMRGHGTRFSSAQRRSLALRRGLFKSRGSDTQFNPPVRSTKITEGFGSGKNLRRGGAVSRSFRPSTGAQNRQAVARRRALLVSAPSGFNTGLQGSTRRGQGLFSRGRSRRGGGFGSVRARLAASGRREAARGAAQRKEARRLAVSRTVASPFLKRGIGLRSRGRATRGGGAGDVGARRDARSLAAFNAAKAARPTITTASTLATIAPDIGRGGNLGNIVGLAPPKPAPTPSKFEIVGGRAIPIGAKTTAKDLSIGDAGGTSFAVSAIKPSGVPEVDEVFANQRLVTVNIANEFRKNRNLALGTGSTDAEANEFARVTTRGLPKQDAEAFNIVFQKAIIERKAGQIEEARRLIKLQTTDGSAGQLDDLAGKLKALDGIEPLPATIINISTNEDGTDLNPRRTAVLIDNALLTGNSIDDLAFTVDDQPFVGIDALAGKGIDTDFLISLLNVNTVDQAINPEDIGGIFDKLTEQTQTTLVQPELIEQAKRGKIVLSRDDIAGITLEGQTERDTKIVQGTFNSQIKEISEGILTEGTKIIENPDGTFSIVDAEGNVIFEDVSSKQILKLTDELVKQINANEGLFEQNEQLLAFITELQELLRGGQSTSGLFESLFSLIAELQAQLAFAQGGGQVEDEEDPLGDFFAFLADINAGVINFIGGIFR